MSSKEGGKGFFELNHWRSEVALEVSLASCAHSDLQTPSQCWGHPQHGVASTEFPKEGVDGRQEGAGATLGVLSGKWAPWEGELSLQDTKKHKRTLLFSR